MTQPERDSNLTPEIVRTIQEALAKICAYTGKRFAVCAMDGDGALDVFIVARDRDPEAKSIADALGAKIRDAAHELTTAHERKHSKTSPTTTTTTTPPPRDKYSLN